MYKVLSVGETCPGGGSRVNCRERKKLARLFSVIPEKKLNRHETTQHTQVKL